MPCSLGFSSPGASGEVHAVRSELVQPAWDPRTTKRRSAEALRCVRGSQAGWTSSQ